MGSIVSNLSKKISKLNRGDEIIILKGEGNPPVPKEIATIVWKVEGYSALTVGGITLSCQNLSDLIVTGRRYETYTVTAEALLIWGEILAAKKEARDQDAEPDWSVPDSLASEPE